VVRAVLGCSCRSRTRWRLHGKEEVRGSIPLSGSLVSAWEASRAAAPDLIQALALGVRTDAVGWLGLDRWRWGRQIGRIPLAACDCPPAHGDRHNEEDQTQDHERCESDAHLALGRYLNVQSDPRHHEDGANDSNDGPLTRRQRRARWITRRCIIGFHSGADDMPRTTSSKRCARRPSSHLPSEATSGRRWCEVRVT
jgi:hypothetical protein